MDQKKALQKHNLSDREKSFYHDLINHTHGLLLYLSHKKKSGFVNSNEIESIVQEIELIQNIIKSHFDDELKLESISLDQFLMEINFLMDIYLKSKSNVVLFNLIDEQYLNQNFMTHGKSYLVRFLSNHFKNIAESAKSNIEIKLSFDGEFLEMTSKNDILDKKDRINEGLGIGLKSMKAMSDLLGGTLSVSHDSTHWYCSLKIVFQSNLNVDRKAS